ncbi:hypothetical protein Tco_1334741 [Tanacetum coccineum]
MPLMEPKELRLSPWKYKIRQMSKGLAEERGLVACPALRWTNPQELQVKSNLNCKANFFGILPYQNWGQYACTRGEDLDAFDHTLASERKRT